MNKSMTIRLLAWVLLTWGVLWALAAWTSFPSLHWISAIFLGVGIFIFRERPLIKAGFPAAFETGVAALFALVFLGHLGYELLAPRFEAEEINSKPCAPQNLEFRCYTFSKQNCTSLWTHFEQECRDETKKSVTSRRATALTGPIVRKCTYKKLDQAFKANRRSPVDPDCEAHFKSLDALNQ